jgi:hypothetical protein
MSDREVRFGWRGITVKFSGRSGVVSLFAMFLMVATQIAAVVLAVSALFELGKDVAALTAAFATFSAIIVTLAFIVGSEAVLVFALSEIPAETKKRRIRQSGVAGILLIGSGLVVGWLSPGKFTGLLLPVGLFLLWVAYAFWKELQRAEQLTTSTTSTTASVS